MGRLLLALLLSEKQIEKCFLNMTTASFLLKRGGVENANDKLLFYW